MRARVPVTLFTVAVLRGVPYPLIKVALEYGAAPLLIAGTRVAIAADALAAAGGFSERPSRRTHSGPRTRRAGGRRRT